jgi:hypothetical protein
MALSRAAKTLSPILLKKKVEDKKPEEDDRDPIRKERGEHLERLEKACAGTTKSARVYYETNRRINLLIVGTGVVLLANSIGYAWYDGTNPWSLFSGGLGISSFATLFFTKPQQNITRALGNLTQIQMIYRAYCLQFDTILDSHIRNVETSTIDDVSKLNMTLRRATENAVMLIQEKVETEEMKKKGVLEQTSSGFKTTSEEKVIATTVPLKNIKEHK